MSLCGYSVSLKDILALLWNEKTFFFSLCIINIYTHTNVVILGIFQSSSEVGYYTAAQKLISIMLSIISIPLTQALYPYIGKAFGKNYNSGINIVQRVVPVVLAITFSAGLVIMIFAPLFIKIFYGSNFVPAIDVCLILAFIPLVISLSSVLGIQVMLNLKLDKYFFTAISTGALFGVMLNLVLVKSYGSIGSAITWISAEVVVLFMLFILLKRKGILIFNSRYFHPKEYQNQFSILKNKLLEKGCFKKVSNH